MVCFHQRERNGYGMVACSSLKFDIISSNILAKTNQSSYKVMFQKKTEHREKNLDMIRTKQPLITLESFVKIPQGNMYIS